MLLAHWIGILFIIIEGSVAVALILDHIKAAMALTFVGLCILIPAFFYLLYSAIAN